MTVTIGRCSLDDAPYSISHSGDVLTFGIDIWAGSLAEAKAQRQQLLGLTPGEVIPVTSTEDADWDGFYSVIAVDIGLPEVYLSTYIMRCAVSLARIGGGYGSARVEVVGSGYNLLSGTTTSEDAWLPEVHHGALGAGAERTTASGTVYEGPALSVGGSAVYTANPDTFYNGACSIEFESDGSWYTLVGKQAPSGAALRITNDLIRVSAGSGVLDLEVYNDSQWEGVASFGFEFAFSPDVPITSVSAPLVLINRPESASLSWDIATDPYNDQPIIARITVMLNRGEPLAMLTHDQDDAELVVAADTAHDPTEVQVSLTDVGYRANAVNADNHKWLLLTFDGSFTGGDISIAHNEHGHIAVVRDGASTDPDHETRVAQECRDALSHRQRVIV